MYRGMASFNIEVSRSHGHIDDDPVEIWKAECMNADAYEAMVAKTPGEALRRLADEFDVEFGAMPRGNWDEYPDVNVGPEA